MDNPELTKYKKTVSNELSKLEPIFAAAVVGDFSKDIKIPETEDQFSQVQAGLQVMLEAIREKIADSTSLNQELESKVTERTKELENRARQLERLNDIMIGREVRIAQLKKEINELKKQFGEAK